MILTVIKWVIIVIALVCIAMYIAISLARFRGGGIAGGATGVTREVYDYVRDYADVIGTSEHAEEYLATVWGISSVNVADTEEIKYKRLYAMIDAVVQKIRPADKYEFIERTGLGYIWFVPAELRGNLINSYRHDVFNVLRARKLLEEMLMPTVLLGDQLNEAIDRLRPYARVMHKYTSAAAKGLFGKAKQKIPELSKDDFETDFVAFSGVLNRVARELKKKRTDERPVSEKLSDVNLITMRLKDPAAVRDFIYRIRAEIKAIEDLPGGIESLAPSIARMPVYRDILREEEIRRKIEQERMERERLEKQREQLQRERERIKEARKEVERAMTKAQPIGPIAQIPPFRGGPAARVPGIKTV